MVIGIVDRKRRSGERPAPGATGEMLDGVGQAASEFLFRDADAALMAVDDFLPHDLSLLDTPNVRTDGIIAHI
jgi:hypothetical protein